MHLVVAPCRALCDWSAGAPAPGAVAQLLTCAGCGSQWEPGQRWTPCQADGTVPAAVVAVRRALTAEGGGGRFSEGTAGAAGTAGS